MSRPQTSSCFRSFETSINSLIYFSQIFLQLLFVLHFQVIRSWFPFSFRFFVHALTSCFVVAYFKRPQVTNCFGTLLLLWTFVFARQYQNHLIVLIIKIIFFGKYSESTIVLAIDWLSDGFIAWIGILHEVSYFARRIWALFCYQHCFVFNEMFLCFSYVLIYWEDFVACVVQQRCLHILWLHSSQCRTVSSELRVFASIITTCM